MIHECGLCERVCVITTNNLVKDLKFNLSNSLVYIHCNSQIHSPLQEGSLHSQKCYSSDAAVCAKCYHTFLLYCDCKMVAVIKQVQAFFILTIESVLIIHL